MDINQLRLMVSCGQILFNNGKLDKFDNLWNYKIF